MHKIASFDFSKAQRAEKYIAGEVFLEISSKIKEGSFASNFLDFF